MKKTVKKYIRNLMKKKEGFSLVEMLVVLIVVAILVAIIIPNVAGQRERIDAQSKINMAEIINTQVENYRIVEGSQGEVNLSQLESEQYITSRQKEQAIKLLGLDESTAIVTPITVAEDD